MSGIGTGYDLSVSTYSPDGRVFQTEFAQKAVDNSGTAVGIKCKDGVVLGVEKLIISKMLVEGSNQRTYALDRHVGVAIAGLPADGRQIVNKGVSEASSYKSFYGSPIPGRVLCERIAGYVHIFNLYWYVRPFGTATLLAAYEKDGPELYMIEPSGQWHAFYGTAVGKGRQAAKTEIERLKLSDMTVQQGLLEVVKILHKVHDDEKPFEIELSWVCDESGKQFKKVPKEIADDVIRQAKAVLDESDMED